MKQLSCPLLTTLLLAMTSLLPMTSLAAQYVGQVKVYVDKYGLDNWYRVTGNSRTSDFWREMNSTFFEVNQILKTMETNGVYLQLQISDIVFLNRNILNTNRYGKIVNKQSLTQFENYVSSSYNNNKYDLAVLFTGYNLVTENFSDKSSGYAYIRTVCSAKALGVIELHGLYDDVLLTAHEIGHILGADHDGVKAGAGCGSSSGYVMNPEVSFASRNHFYFSSCSARQIKSKLDEMTSNKNNCMSRWYYSGDISGPRYGTLMTPDKICKRKYGSSSYVARKAYSSYGDSICVQLACMTKTVGNHFYWTYVATPQGLKCGQNKQCIQGKCVKTSGGSAQVSDKCPFGDQPKIEGNFQMTCSDMTASKCSGWKDTCCQTCNDPGTADEVCRSLEGKDSAMARLHYSSYGDNLCTQLACVTSVKGTYFNWNYHTAPDGMKCGKNKRCSSGKCVTNSLGDPNTSDSCPFGDQPWLAGDWQSTCVDHVRKNGCSTSMSKVCCGSCTDPGTADEVCKRLEGQNSAMARRAYSSYGNNLCSKLACLTRVSGTTFSWMNYKAPDGMKCGKNKRCSKGQCLSTSFGDASISDSCPYGDQPWLAGNWKTTCSDYVRRNGCSGSGWSQICCSSC